MESERIMLCFDENCWQKFEGVTYGGTNTQCKGFQKIYSKHSKKKNLLIKRWQWAAVWQKSYSSNDMQNI